ncbi:HAD family hydrolase [Streptomyces polyrhachis]|uniref:HAD family hydrolase n=1 Tax=Streptomyces polyrhachis TaxID=1282885 RepID=A0ABW2GNP8_9ACTN
MADTRASETPDALRRLLAAARCVLFDFDGPVCRLFAGRSSADIAARLREWMLAEGHGEAVRLAHEAFADAYTVMRHLAATGADPVVIAAVEKHLTQEELAATATAWPTPHADPLIHTLRAIGRQVAVATNNAPEPVHRYLEDRGLANCFGPHIHGRTEDALRLKPDPSSLRRALASTGVSAAEAVMLGDSWVDLEAARALDVPFIGYATSPEKGTLLRDRGARIVLDDLFPLLQATLSLRSTPAM